jgi:transcriptional regulator with XRE-family HTH domain
VTVSEAVALRIQTLCQEKNISVNRLAKLSGLSQSTVASIIDGRSNNPGLATLNKIAKGFGMSLQEFLNFPELNNADLD